MKLLRELWWVGFVLAIVLLIGALPGYWAGIHLGDASARFSPLQQAALGLSALLSIGCVVVCLGLAALLILKKPNDRMAVLLALYLVMYGSVLAGPLETFFPYWFPTLGNFATNLQALVFPVPTLILLLIFPSGHFTPRWTRWLVLAALGLVLYTLSIIPSLDALTNINLLALQFVYVAFGSMLIVSLGVQVYRYRYVSTATERQQTKWVLYGSALAYTLLVFFSIPYYYVQNLPVNAPMPWWAPFDNLGWWFALSIQPVAVTLAILRTRLWDIDVIVRRTVVYTAVTLTLALVYFVSVILLQRVFSLFTGGQQNEIVTVLSTLAIAALFVPVRNRIQKAIDLQFNRNKYNAQQVLQKFSETVRDETDLEKLTEELVKVVNETMQPKSIQLLLRPTREQRHLVRE